MRKVKGFRLFAGGIWTFLNAVQLFYCFGFCGQVDSMLSWLPPFSHFICRSIWKQSPASQRLRVSVKDLFASADWGCFLELQWCNFHEPHLPAWNITFLKLLSLWCFFPSQMEMISEPDPDDEGTKISVSWKLASWSNLHSYPAEYNSSWFPWITHFQWEKGDNQWNQWQCIISVKVVPFLLQKGCAPFLSPFCCSVCFPASLPVDWWQFEVK